MTRPRSDFISADSVNPPAMVSSTNLAIAIDDIALTIAAAGGCASPSIASSSTFST